MTGIRKKFLCLHWFHLATAMMALTSLVPDVRAQRLPVRNYTPETGLPHSQITRVYQDSKGFIWFLSQSGLTRYDGHDYLTYNKQDGFSSNIAVSLFEDSVGRLWALMNNGLSVFQVSVDGQITQHDKLDYRNGLPYDEYTAMLPDTGNVIWLGTRGNGLLRIELDFSSGRMALRRKTMISVGNGLTGTNVHDIFRDHKNNFWIATDRGISVIQIINPAAFVYHIKPLTVREGLASNDVSRIIQDRSDVIWAGTRKGLCQLIDVLESQNQIKFKSFGRSEGLIDNQINDLSMDRVGHIWMVTPGGLSKFFLMDRRQSKSKNDAPAVTNYGRRHGFLEKGFQSLFIDRQNIIWLTTPAGNVSKLISERFHTYTTAEGLLHPETGPVFQGRSGQIYAGSGSGLMTVNSVLNDAGEKEISLSAVAMPSRPAELMIQDICEDRKGSVWVATEKGIYTVRGRQAFPGKTYPELENRSLRRLLIDQAQNLWVGTSSGLFRIGQDKVHSFSRSDGLSNESIRFLMTDHFGHLWIGTQDGLGVIYAKDMYSERPAIRHFSDPELANKYITHIYEDRLHDLWVGTDGGLIRLVRNNTETVQKISAVQLAASGFISNYIVSVIQDPTGLLWVMTRKGVHIFDPENNSVRRIWTKKDGLAGNEGLSPGGLMRDREGTLWIGLSGGLSRYFPKVDYEIDAPPLIYFKKLYANDELRNIEETIVLPHRTRQISVDFTGLDFISEETVQYQVMLEGHDQTWNDPTFQRKMRFSSLSSGNYVLKVRLYDPYSPRAGLIQQTLPVSIETHPLRQWWSYAVLIFVAAGLIYAIYRRRVSFVRERTEELENKIHLRTQEIRNQNEQIKKQQHALEQQKKQLELTIRELSRTQNDLIHSKKMASLIQIVAGIAHELNNPLSNVYGNINLLKDYVRDIKNLLEAYQQRRSAGGDSSPEQIRSLDDRITKVMDDMDYDFVMEDIQQLTDSIDKGTRRLIQIVENLRRFSRLDESVVKEFDVNESLRNVTELFINQYRFSLRIETQYRNIPPITGYPQELNQALMQILLNAAQAILALKEQPAVLQGNEKADLPDRGLIAIETELVYLEVPGLIADFIDDTDEFRRNRQPAIRIRIRDDGIGIRDEHKEKIFDPFFTTRRIGEGTGLGLSVAYSIVEKHNGKIFFNSQYLEGSEFIIELPIQNAIRNQS